jgi:O-antigen/teichoic acid export membrane protein
VPAVDKADGRSAAPALRVQAFWLIVARALGFVFTLALPILMVRVFDKVQFGAYKQAFILIGTAQALLPLGFGVTAFYFLAREPGRRPAVILNIVLYHAAISLLAFLTFLVWPGIVTLILGSDKLAYLAPVIGAIICLAVFSSFLEMVATANADVAWSTSFIIGAQLSRTVLLLVAAAIFRTVEAVLYASMIQAALQSITLVWYLQSRFPFFWRHFDADLARDQVKYAVPFGLAGLLFAIQSDLHNYLVSHEFTTAEFALYTVGTSQLPFIGILRESVSSVLLSRYSRLQQENRTAEILDLMLRSWRKLAAVIFPALAALMVLGPDFIAVLYTKDYLASWPIFRMNLLLLLLSVFITDAVIRTYAEYRYVFMGFRFISLVFQIVVSLLIIPVTGMIGALIGMMAAYVLERALSFRVVLRVLGFRPHDLKRLSGVAAFALAAATAAGVTFFMLAMTHLSSSYVRLAGGGAVFTLVYFGIVVFFGLLDGEERDLINRYSVRFLRRQIV